MGGTEDRECGKVLIDNGWDQGVQLPVIGHAFFTLDNNDRWTITEEHSTLTATHFIVVSQACDIVAPSEPYVEAMPCYWEKKGSNRYNGARTGNSSRYFLIRYEENASGQAGAVVVDATRRVQIAKTSLLRLSPKIQIDADNQAQFSRRFRRWLGGRYSRPALDPALVAEVQRPIVEAVRSLRPDDEVYGALDLIREVRMEPISGDPPFAVHLKVLLEYDIAPNDERIIGFRGLLEEAINRGPGESSLIRCETFTADDMFVSEYENTIPLPLDQYSLDGEAIKGAVPVLEIDQG